MAEQFVTGIIPTCDIAELERVIGSIAGIDRSRLTVITKATRSDDHDRSFLNFLHASGPIIDAETAGTGLLEPDRIMTTSGGTGVPGIGSNQTSYGTLHYPRLIQHVANLPIPDDEADNYNDALDDGRCVVAYQAEPAEVAAYESAFDKAGIRKVKTFARA